MASLKLGKTTAEQVLKRLNRSDCYGYSKRYFTYF